MATRRRSASYDGLEGEIARGVADVPAVQVLLTITGMGFIGAAAAAVAARRFDADDYARRVQALIAPAS